MMSHSQCSLKVEKKQHFFQTPAGKNFQNRHLQNLDAISFTGGNFIKHNFAIFSRMPGIYFHDLSRSQVTGRIYNSERCKKVQTHFGNSLLVRLIEKILGASSRFMR